MSNGSEFTSAGAGFEDSGFYDQPDADDAFVEMLRGFAQGGGDGNAFETQWEGSGLFEEAFQATTRPSSPASPALAAPLTPSTPPPRSGFDSAVSLSNSLDDAGVRLLNDKLCAMPEESTSSNYAPHPHILAHQPAAPHDPYALYSPITTSHFRTAAEAKAHRRRPRLAPKSHAQDIVRVKNHGRNYWVCRLFNAMIDRSAITDGASSIHRTRFTRLRAFEPLDLEATAHAIFDEAIAVHERGWNRPKVYHKHAVRGKLVDVSEGSLELRLSRICLVLQQTKSAVDDAVRGGVTLALLCDNPEARRFTKVANNDGNRKRGERLKMTAAKERAKVQKVESEFVVDAEVEEQEQGGVCQEEVTGVPEVEDEERSRRVEAA